MRAGPLSGRRVLLATSEPVHPLAWGGIEASAHDLAVGLARELGADVRVLTAGSPAVVSAGARRLAELGIAAEGRGALDYRPGPYHARIVPLEAFEGELEGALGDWRPDLVVAQAAGWRAVVSRSRARGLRVVHWLHGWLGLEGGPPWPEADRNLANSEYTRRVVAERFGLASEVFHPPVEPERVLFRGEPGRGDAVAMVNPHPLKGVDRFLELAEIFPGKRFVAAEAWGTPPFVLRRLGRLPNVEHLPARTDLAALYGRTAVLLVPTSWDETFGRVVVEANLNAVPVLASSRGALPDVVGGGGRVLDYEAPLAEWAAALGELLDPARRTGWAARARGNASRHDFRAALARFEQLATS